MGVIDQLVGTALAAIDERGVDVVRQPEEVAQIAREAVGRGGHDDPEILLAVTDRVSAFGPLHRLFDDPTVEEVWWNRPDRIMVARNGIATVSELSLTDDQVVLLVERMLRTSGRRLDLSQPFVDASLADGSRLHKPSDLYAYATSA